jgi:hypothetical protein
MGGFIRAAVAPRWRICTFVQPDVQNLPIDPPPSLGSTSWSIFAHARSQTPAWYFFRTREGPNMLLLQYVRPLGCLFNQTSLFSFRRRLPRGMLAF